jgi:hypothetical protein
MLFIMWVYMETWIVQDGAPELDRGSYLPGVGLRPDCLSMGPPRTPVDGIAELADRAGGHLHESHRIGQGCPGTGLRSGHAGSEFVITTGDQAFIGRTAGRASVVAADSRLTAQCMLSVVADSERDAFGLPDLPQRLVRAPSEDRAQSDR